MTAQKRLVQDALLQAKSDQIWARIYGSRAQDNAKAQGGFFLQTRRAVKLFGGVVLSTYTIYTNSLFSTPPGNVIMQGTRGSAAVDEAYVQERV